MTRPERPAQPGDLSPSHMGRCDICGTPIDLESGDTLLITDEDCYGYEDEDFHVSAEEAIDAILDALDFTDNTHDDMLADALREKQGYTIHDRCWEKTSLADAPIPENTRGLE